MVERGVCGSARAPRIGARRRGEVASLFRPAVVVSGVASDAGVFLWWLEDVPQLGTQWFGHAKVSAKTLAGVLPSRQQRLEGFSGPRVVGGEQVRREGSE